MAMSRQWQSRNSYAGDVGTLLRKPWRANVSLSVMMSRTSISEKYAVKYPKRT